MNFSVQLVKGQCTLGTARKKENIYCIYSLQVVYISYSPINKLTHTMHNIAS